MPQKMHKIVKNAPRCGTPSMQYVTLAPPFFVFGGLPTRTNYNPMLTREGQDVMSVAGTTASDGLPTSEVVEVEPSSAAEPSRPMSTALFDTREVSSHEIPCFLRPVKSRPVESRAFYVPQIPFREIPW